MSMSSSSSQNNGNGTYNNSWSEHLLEEVIEMIVKRLSTKDSIRFAAVCKSWRSVASQHIKRTTQVPWIMESYASPYSTKVKCSFYSPSENKAYNFRNFPFPAVEEDVHYRGIQCLGSIDGWLIIVEHSWHRPCKSTSTESATVDNYFLNPMTGVRIMLPSQSTIPWKKNSFLLKIVASSIPTRSDCIVAAITSDKKKLGFCRPTDETWTCQDIDTTRFTRFSDLQFRKDGKLYVMVEAYSKYLLVFDPVDVLSHDNKPENNNNNNNEYKGKTLVICLEGKYVKTDMGMRDPVSLIRSSNGEILLVLRDKKKAVFFVFKLKLDEIDCPKWIKMDNNLEDEVIFVGDGGGTSVPKSKLTNSNSKFLGAGGENSCIYFARDVEDQRKIGIHKLAERNGVKYPSTGGLKPDRIRVWFTPKPLITVLEPS